MRGSIAICHAARNRIIAAAATLFLASRNAGSSAGGSVEAN
jgi:hypothetical protein